MTRTLVKTSSEDEPTTDSGHDNVGIVRPPRRRTTARIHRPISRVTELRQNAAELAEWPDDDRRSRIVFITHDLDRSVIEEKLDSLTEQAAALDP